MTKLIIAGAIGFVVGALVYRNNRKETEKIIKKVIKKI